MKIALALSGGGFRATVFHLGVLARLAEEDRLGQVTIISTVSGGSLAVGLIYALNGYRWPTSSEYLEQVLPQARRLLTTLDLQKALVLHGLKHFWRVFQTRADDLSFLLQKHWGITANLADLPEQPRWMINATCYETGKNWRFERFRMGDYAFGYSRDTALPLSDALAASAGFPGAIGALALDAGGRSWYKYVDRGPDGQETAKGDAPRARTTELAEPPFDKVHLWDGGVYDNHGLEGLHDFIDGWRKDIDFLIVSDGAGRSQPESYRPGVKALLRIITGIMMDQIRSLRSRAVMERLINHQDRGVFLQTGNTCRYVLDSAGKEAQVATLCPACLSEEEAELAANMPTVIRKLTIAEYERLFRHGFEVADYTLYAYAGDDFGYVGDARSR